MFLRKSMYSQHCFKPTFPDQYKRQHHFIYFAPKPDESQKVYHIQYVSSKDSANALHILSLVSVFVDCYLHSLVQTLCRSESTGSYASSFSNIKCGTLSIDITQLFPSKIKAAKLFILCKD